MFNAKFGRHHNVVYVIDKNATNVASGECQGQPRSLFLSGNVTHACTHTYINGHAHICPHAHILSVHNILFFSTFYKRKTSVSRDVSRICCYTNRKQQSTHSGSIMCRYLTLWVSGAVVVVMNILIKTATNTQNVNII